MIENKNDKINVTETLAEFNDVKEQKMGELNFLPSIGIDLMSNTFDVRSRIDDDPDIDLFDTKIGDNFFMWLQKKGKRVQMRLPKINLDKLSQYFVFNLTIKNLKRQEEEEHSILGKFKYCDVKHFEERNVKIEPYFEDIIQKRICPDMKEIEDQLRVKHIYEDTKERISFAISARRCNPTIDTDIECKPPEAVDKVAKLLMFSVFYIDDFINYHAED